MSHSETPEIPGDGGSPTISPDASAHVPAWAVPPGSADGFGPSPVMELPDQLAADLCAREPSVGVSPATVGGRAVPLRRSRGLLVLAGGAAAVVLAGGGFLVGAGLHRGGGSDTTTLIARSSQSDPGGAG